MSTESSEPPPNAAAPTSAAAATAAPTRLTPSEARELAVRIGLAWREIRRGASAGLLRDFLYTIDSDQLEGTQIELGQMDTLDLLATRPSWRMSELADALRVEPSTATRAVQRLERAGLARRRPSATDGRVVKVEITEAGCEVHRTVVARRSELMAHIIRNYSAAELPVFVDLLERFVSAVDGFVASRAD